MSQDLETAASPSPAAPPERPSDGALGAGATLGDGRYTIDSRIRSGAFADIYHATDEETGNPVSVHLLHDALRAAGEAVLERARAVAELDHKNIARTLDSDTDNGRVYVVTEYLEGNPLRELLERKKTTGKRGFGARGANNILGGVCNAMSSAHPDLPHGAISSDSVYINKAGRVKLVDFALAAAMPAAVKAGVLTPGPGVAPEQAKTGEASAAADLFSLGVLLYEAIVGEPLKKGGPRPSDVDEVSQSVDTLVARCCAPQPAKRPPDAATLKVEIAAALKKKGDGRASGRHAAAAAAAASSASMPAMPAAGSRPSLAQAIAEPRSSGSQPSMSALADTEEKWLISKGKLDYGPFSLAAIVDEIRTNQVLPGHVIVDKDTGGRSAVEDHPLLGDLIEQAKQTRDDERRAQAEVQHSKQETRRGTTLYAFIAIAVLVIGAVAFFVVRSMRSGSWSPSIAVNGSPGSVEWTYGVIAIDEDGKRLKVSDTRGTTAGAPALGKNDFNRITWPSVSGAKNYEIFRVAGTGSTGKIGAVSADTKPLAFDDIGQEGDGQVMSRKMGSLEEGQLQAKFTFPTPPKRRKRSGRRSGKRRSSRSGGGGGGGAGADDSGGGFDFSREGGEEILDQSRINPVIRRSGSKLARCLLSKGASRADITFTIKRTGRVSKVTVDGANSDASSCLKRVVKSMKFPSFDGNYTIARFDMSL